MDSIAGCPALRRRSWEVTSSLSHGEPPIVDIDDARVPRAHLQMRPTKNEELKQLKKLIHASELLDLGRQVGW